MSNNCETLLINRNINCITLNEHQQCNAVSAYIWKMGSVGACLRGMSDRLCQYLCLDSAHEVMNGTVYGSINC